MSASPLARAKSSLGAPGRRPRRARAPRALLALLLGGCAAVPVELGPPEGEEVLTLLEPSGGPPDPGPYRHVLKRFVRSDGRVDYRGLSIEPQMLELFLADCADTDVSALPADLRLAFWIDLYNAFFLRAVVAWHPLDEVRDEPAIDRRAVLEVDGERLTLASLRERKLLAAGDPRVLFALRTGSESGPRVPGEPFLAEGLDARLDRQVRDFLGDPRRNRFDRDARRASISRLFDRYRDVFVAAAEAAGAPLDERAAVLSFLASHRASLRPWILEEGVVVDFLPWREELFAAR